MDRRNPPDEWWEQGVREALERVRDRQAREAAGEVFRPLPAARVSQLIRDLIARFEKDGRADPAVAREMVGQMRQEADGGA